MLLDEDIKQYIRQEIKRAVWKDDNGWREYDTELVNVDDNRWRQTGLAIGSLLDARDFHKKWYMAKVIDSCIHAVKIHYVDYPTDKWDDWIERTSESLAPLHSHTAKLPVAELVRYLTPGATVEFRDQYNKMDEGIVERVRAGRATIFVRCKDGSARWIKFDDLAKPVGARWETREEVLARVQSKKINKKQ